MRHFDIMFTLTWIIGIVLTVLKLAVVVIVLWWLGSVAIKLADKYDVNPLRDSPAQESPE